MSTEQKQDQVRKEGEMLAGKAQELKNFTPSGDIPSNKDITGALSEGQTLLEHAKNSEIGQETLGRQGKKVIGDIQTLLEDERKMVEQKNEGDAVQKMLSHGMDMVSDLSHEDIFHGILTNWKGIVASIARSGDIQEMLKSAGELASNLQDTENFFQLLVQLRKMVTLLLNERLNLLTNQNAQNELEARRQEVMKQLNLTLDSISNNPTWKLMMERGKHLKNKIEKKGEQGIEKTQDEIAKVMDKESVKIFIDDVKKTLQALTGPDVDVEPFFRSTKAAIEDILNNQEFSSIIDDTYSLFSRIAERPSLVDEEDTQKQLKSLLERTEKEIQELRSNPHFSEARSESIKIKRGLKKDPLNAKMYKDMKKLLRDIKSNKGQMLDPKIIENMRQIIVPMFLEHVATIPLPPVRDTANILGEFEYTLDNIRLNTVNLLPDNIHIKVMYDLEANPLKLAAHHYKTVIYVKAKNIQIHLKDVQFTYHRLTLPKLHDSGLVDVDTEGDGVEIRLMLRLAGGDKEEKTFVVQDAQCFIDKWKVNFKESKHDTMYEVLSGMFLKTLKKEIQRNVQEKLKAFGSTIDKQVTSLLDQFDDKKKEYIEMMQEAKEDAKDKALELKDTIADKAGDMKTNIQKNAVQSAIDMKNSEGFQKVAEGLKDAKDSTIQSMNEVKNSQGFQEAKGMAKDKASEMGETIKQTASNVLNSDSLAEAKDAAVEGGKQMKQEAQRDYQDMKNSNVAQDMSNAASNIKEKAQDKLDDVENSRTLREATQKAKDNASDMKNDLSAEKDKVLHGDNTVHAPIPPPLPSQ